VQEKRNASVHRQVDSVKIAPNTTGHDVAVVVYSAPGMDKQQALLNTVLNFEVP
jgi:hypothetical protein